MKTQAKTRKEMEELWDLKDFAGVNCGRESISLAGGVIVTRSETAGPRINSGRSRAYFP